MKKMKTLVVVIGLAAATMACTRVSGTTKIVGTVEDMFDEVNIVVEKLQIDTLVPVENGRFSCEIPTDPTEVGMIAAGYYRAVFIPDGTTLDVTLAPESSVSSSGKGVQSRYEAMEEAINDYNAGFMEEMQTLSSREDLSEEEVTAMLSDSYDQLEAEVVDYLEQVVYDNRDNAVSAVAIGSLSGIIEDDQLAYLISTLSEEMQSNTLIASMKEELEVRDGTTEGKMFTDFTIEDSDGKTVSLSDYVGRGKYVLVDFWASWCGPCKEEIPNVKTAYNKYHKAGLEVLSIAVWDEPEDTKAAAKQLGITWSQIINAGKVPTDVYGITGIPHIILFGPDGTILKRGLRGEAIDQELSKYFR